MQHKCEQGMFAHILCSTATRISAQLIRLAIKQCCAVTRKEKTTQAKHPLHQIQEEEAHWSQVPDYKFEVNQKPLCLALLLNGWSLPAECHGRRQMQEQERQDYEAGYQPAGKGLQELQEKAISQEVRLLACS